MGGGWLRDGPGMCARWPRYGWRMGQGWAWDGFQVKENSERRHATLAVVEWECRAVLNEITLLPQSQRQRGRVWKGSNPTAARASLVGRVVGHLGISIGRFIVRHYVDTAFGDFRQRDINSNYQLRCG